MKIRNFLLSTLALGCSIAIANLPKKTPVTVNADTSDITVISNFDTDYKNSSITETDSNKKLFTGTIPLTLYNNNVLDSNISFSATNHNGNGEACLRKYTGLQLRYGNNNDGGDYFTLQAAQNCAIKSVVVCIDAANASTPNKIEMFDLAGNSYDTIRNISNWSEITLGTKTYTNSYTFNPTQKIGKFVYTNQRTDGNGSDTSKAKITIKAVAVTYKQIEICTLTYDTKGGSSINSAAYEKGEIPTRPADPTKANSGSTKYTFDGWYTDSECTPGNEYNFDTALNTNLTIYAKWNESQVTGFTLTFHTNGLHSVTSQTVESGVKFVEPVITDHIGDAKYDYTLIGWYTDETYASEFNFDVAYTEDKDAYAKYSYAQNVLSGATAVSMKNKVQTYANGWSIDSYEEHTVPSSSVSSSMVASVFSYKNAYADETGGIKFTGTKNKDGSITYNKYDVKMKYCVATWQLIDYSKYIKTVRWDLKNTGYKYNLNYIVDLFDNVDCTGDAIDSDYLCLVSGEKDRCIQMIDNANETINGVAFKQRRVEFDYGFEKLQYILGDASAAQQAKNFAKDFLDLMTCSGEGSITAESGSWALLASRVSSYLSADAKTLLASYDGSDQTIIDALARYDYIVAKYGTSSYDNFLNRTISSKGGPLLSLSKLGSSVTTDAIVVSAAVICLVTLGTLYFFKKRKENF